MKKGLLVCISILFAMSGLAQAQEPELHGAFNLTYQSKYVWRGFDIFDGKSGVQASLDLDLFGTGFGASVMAHRANSGEFENGERWDYTIYYANQLFSGEDYATNYRLDYVWYNYPDNSTKGDNLPFAPNASLQELNLILSWPSICPAGIVPTYVLVKMWPLKSGSFSGSRSSIAFPPGASGTASGWAHIFMLDYSFTIEGILPEIPEHVINLHSELVYNDGIGPAGQRVDHEWSNVVFGASTDLELAENLILTPAVYHQMTMEESVNEDEDETWVTLGATFKF